MKKIKFFETSCIDIDTGIDLGITKNTREEAEDEAWDYIGYLLENKRELKYAIRRHILEYRWAAICVSLEECEAEFENEELDESGEYIGDDDFYDLRYRRKNILSTDTWVMSTDDATEGNASFSVIRHTEGGTEYFSARAAVDNFEDSQLVSHIPEDPIGEYLINVDFDDEDIIESHENIDLEEIDDKRFDAWQINDYETLRSLSDSLAKAVKSGNIKLSTQALAEILRESDGIEI